MHFTYSSLGLLLAWFCHPSPVTSDAITGTRNVLSIQWSVKVSYFKIFDLKICLFLLELGKYFSWLRQGKFSPWLGSEYEFSVPDMILTWVNICPRPSIRVLHVFVCRLLFRQVSCSISTIILIPSLLHILMHYLEGTW